MRRKSALIASATVILIGLLAVAAPASPTLHEFPLTTKDRSPLGATLGPDGNVWFTESAGGGAIGRITPAGTITEFTEGLTAESHPTGITEGPDGNLWFTESANPGGIGRITRNGVITEFTGGLTKDSQPTGITAGPDGNVWFTEAAGAGAIGRICPEGEITEFTEGLSPNSQPTSITEGPDGNLWFTESAGNGAIGRITPEGEITEFTKGLTPNSKPTGIVAGPDGRLWFTEAANPGRIGRITINGWITELSSGLTANSQPEAITVGGDGALYFTEAANPAQIGRITTKGVITETATPTTGSQPQGLTTGGDGNIWFTENGAHGQIGTLSVAPGVTGATNVATEQTAVLRARVLPNSQATSYHFEWGPSSSYGNVTQTASAGSGAGVVKVSAPISGLETGTTYHYRAVATNTTGTTYGPDETVTTSEAPEVSAAPAAGVTLSGATLVGEVDPNYQATSYRFEWGTTTEYGNELPLGGAELGSTDDTLHPVEAVLAGLTPDTIYHFRAVATNCGGCSEGTTVGPDETFTTAAPPGALTGAASALSSGGATLNGSVSPHEAKTGYHFEWGETTAYGSQTPSVEVVADSLTHAVSEPITGLEPGRLYHYRIVATNCEGCEAGTVFGADQTFTTQSPPAATTTTPAPTPPSSSLSASLTPPLGPPPPPQIGLSAQVHSLRGSVTMHSPSRGTWTLEGSDTVPVGTIIDAEHGAIQITTATDGSGHTQSAIVWGAAFSVAQTRGHGGMTTFVTHAGSRGCTARARRSSLASAARSRRAGHQPPTLWAHDNHGRFSTRGQNSVATVRGTLWGTTERCNGTLTTVKQGVVLVKPRHGRPRTVRAGHSFLARA
ncbi:MAG TPA: hypothetical protein VKG82_11315 [Solirubrobacteraceae bacterium]|nr:hypothetical protein [Solirubrobacteraceae bacterium]